MRKSHRIIPPKLLIALSLVVLNLSIATAQTAVTDSGIVISTARPSKIPTSTYDKVLANPTVLYDGSKRVVEYSVSFLPKGKDYCGPFVMRVNKFPDKAITALQRYKTEEVPVTKMFIDGIGIRERDSVRHIKGSVIITLTP